MLFSDLGIYWCFVRLICCPSYNRYRTNQKTEKLIKWTTNVKSSAHQQTLLSYILGEIVPKNVKDRKLISKIYKGFLQLNKYFQNPI